MDKRQSAYYIGIELCIVAIGMALGIFLIQKDWLLYAATTCVLILVMVNNFVRRLKE